MVIAGFGGATRHACAALGAGGRVIGVCEQERVSRVRGAGFNPSGLPDEALDLLLERRGLTRQSIGRYVSGEDRAAHDQGPPVEPLDHHQTHASTAYFSSASSSATIVVCDREAPRASVWEGRGAGLTRVDWPAAAPDFVDLYARCAALFHFEDAGGEQRLEAIARVRPDGDPGRFARLFRLDEGGLAVAPQWEAEVRGALDAGNSIEARAEVASALQGRIGDLVLEWLGEVRRRTSSDRLCLAGSLFYHSSINTRVTRSGLFAHVSIPVDPGNAGLAVGAALHASGSAPQPVSPFLGPAYGAAEIKETLDNCKLRYSWEQEDTVIDMAVRALVKGRLVGWFEGAMEWGPRALGARCILASPFAPYVLENLNRFLKRREAWRGYALSGRADALREHFDGPADSPFMECDYRPRDPERFRHVLPSPGASLRAQTVGPDSPPRFARLLDAFEAATGLPVLVNTSFNAFQEPIVCSPRDAVRVFYGSGIDLLALEQFVLAK